jgi:hypothetical protein
MGNYTFGGCDNLTSLIVGEGISHVDTNLVTHPKLHTIIFGNNVSSFASGAFNNTNLLTHITFKSLIPPRFSTGFLVKTSPDIEIYVPYGSLHAYKESFATDGINPDILDKIVELDREAMMSDVNFLKSEIQAELVGKTDYLGTVAAMTDLSTIAGAGDYHRVSTEFIYDESTGEKAHVGDILIAVIDLAGLVNTQTKEYWDLVHTELGAAPATQEDINSIFEEA